MKNKIDLLSLMLFSVGMCSFLGCEKPPQPVDPYQNVTPINQTPPGTSPPPTSVSETQPNGSPPVEPPTSTAPPIKVTPKSDPPPIKMTPRATGTPPAQIAMTLVPQANAKVIMQAREFESGAERDTSVLWTMKPDPLPQEMQQSDTLTAGVRIPASAPEGSMRVLYPSQSAAIVAVGINQGDTTREVWDLRDKNQIGTITGLSLGETNRLALSNDGHYFAAHPEATEVIGLYDVVKGSPHGVIPIVSTGVQFLAFIGNDRLLYIKDDTLRTYTVNPLAEIDNKSVAFLPRKESYRVSPGGNYLTYFEFGDTWHLIAIDLKKLGSAGRLKIGESIDAAGSAVSHDGRTLAVVFTRGPQAWVQLWDISTGRIGSEEKLNQVIPVQHNSVCEIEWFPNGQQLLLFGNTLVDPQTAEVSKVLPESNDPVRPAFEGQVVHSRGGILQAVDPYARQQETKPTVPVARNDAPKVSAERFDDSPYPPLTDPDRSVLQQFTLGDLKTFWKYIPRRPKSEAKKVVSRPVSIPEGQIYRAHLSNGEWPYAAIGYSEMPLDPSNKVRDPSEVTENRSWIEWFEMRAGTKKKPLELPMTATLEALNHNGDTVVTRIENGMDRLDFWSLKQGEHLFGFRPYATADDPTGLAVEKVLFFGEDGLITYGGGNLTCWKIPQCKAIWEMPVGPFPPVLTPAQDSIVVTVPDDSAFCMVSADTGETTGVLSSGASGGNRTTTVAFHPQGEEMAVFSGHGLGSQVYRYDLALKKLKDSFPLPVPVTEAQWLDDDYLLLDGTYLVSWKDRAIAWNYDLSVGMNVADLLDNRHWYLAADGSEFSLVGVPLPDSSARTALQKRSAQPDVVLTKGKTLSLVNSVDTLKFNQAQPVLEQFRTQLEKLGMRILDGQDVGLTLHSQIAPTGRQLVGEITTEVPKGVKVPTVSIPEEKLTLKVTIERNGDVIWESEASDTNICDFHFNSGSRSDEVHAVAVSAALDLMWERCLQKVAKIKIPETLFAPGSQKGLGKSQLTIRGVE